MRQETEDKLDRAFEKIIDWPWYYQIPFLGIVAALLLITVFGLAAVTIILAVKLLGWFLIPVGAVLALGYVLYRLVQETR